MTMQDDLARQTAAAQMLREEYDAKLTEEMGKLHNQFVGFISSARIPLPHIMLVLTMLQRETLDQAYKQYLGE